MCILCLVICFASLFLFYSLFYKLDSGRWFVENSHLSTIGGESRFFLSVLQFSLRGFSSARFTAFACVIGLL